MSGPATPRRACLQAPREDREHEQLSCCMCIPTERAGMRRRLWPGWWPYCRSACSLVLTLSYPGEARLPRPCLPALGPLGGSLPCPGPELLTSSDECGLEEGGGSRTKPVTQGLCCPDLVRQPESLVDVLYKVYHKLHISSKGSW